MQRRLLPVEIQKMARRLADRSALAIVAALIGALSIEFYFFARLQDIWLDEATQLSGLSLKFWQMLQWLGGVDPGGLGVPGDRTPPLVYLLDWSWLWLFGPSELGLRLFHSAFVVAGISCLAAVSWREVGRSATIVWVGFLVLSPKLVQAGVEIRAYALFFGITCAQTAVFLRLAACPKVNLRLLAVFVALCLLAIYSHFYGVVSVCAFFLALGISRLRRSAPLADIIGAFAAVVIGSLGLVPFVLGAAQVSGALFVPASSTGIEFAPRSTGQYLSYLLKLVGDPANMISIPASLLFFCGTIALLCAGIFAAMVRARNAKSKPVDWCNVVVASGVLATIVAGLLVSVRTFDALRTSYGIWLLVPFSLLVGAGATTVTGFRLWDVAGSRLAAGAVMLGAGMSTFGFLSHAGEFVHGPHRFIAALYDKAAGPKAIVYDNGALWGWSFVPLQYSHHGKVVQYRTTKDGRGLVRAGGRDAKATIQDMQSTIAAYRVLLLTDIRTRSYRDLRQCQNQPAACPGFPSSALAAALTGTGQWREIGKERSLGFYDAHVTVLERSESDPQGLVRHQD